MKNNNISATQLYWYDSENDIYKPIWGEGEGVNLLVPKVELYWYEEATDSYKPLIKDGTMPISEDVVNNIKESLHGDIDDINSQLAQTESKLNTNSQAIDILKSSKIDNVVYNPTTNKVDFYVQNNVVTSLDLTTAQNNAEIRTYIDSLVSSGQIEGATLSANSVDKTHMASNINKHSLITGVVAGAEGIIVDFSSKTISTGLNQCRIITSRGTYNLPRDQVIDLSNMSGIKLIAHNTQSQALEVFDRSSTYNYDKYSIIGMVDITSENVFIQGEHVVIPSTELHDHTRLFNGILQATDPSIVIDFTKNELVAKETGWRFIRNDRGEITVFSGGKYSFEGTSTVFYLAYRRSTNEFVFVDGNETLNYDYDDYLFFGVVVKRLGAEQVYINGVGYEVITNNESSNSDGNGGGLSQPFYFLGDPGGSYVSNVEDFVSMDTMRDYEGFMGLYEQLRAENPDYITRQKLGESTNGLDIYRYDFNYYDVMNTVAPKPIIYLNCSIHGVEMQAHYPVFSFLKDLTNNWLTNDLLGWIHNNVHIVVVPLSNPDGFVANTRVNANHVDLNRNFPHGWNNDDNLDNTSIYYPGSSPASEVETQILINLVNELKPYAMFDFHNNGSLESKKDLISISSGNEKLGYFIKAFGNNFDYLMRKEFPEMANWNHSRYNFVMDRQQERRGSFARYGQVEGYNSMIVELTTGWDPYPTDVAQKINRDAIGNLILGVMRSTDRL